MTGSTMTYADFILEMFRGATNNILIESLSEDGAEPRAITVFTHSPGVIRAFCREWGKPGRSIGHGMCARRKGPHTGTSENVMKYPDLVVAIDTGNGLDQDAVVEKLIALPFLPSVIMRDGGDGVPGVDVYWQFADGVDAPPGGNSNAIIAVLKRLAGVCGGGREAA